MFYQQTRHSKNSSHIARRRTFFQGDVIGMIVLQPTRIPFDRTQRFGVGRGEYMEITSFRRVKYERMRLWLPSRANGKMKTFKYTPTIDKSDAIHPKASIIKLSHIKRFSQESYFQRQPFLVVLYY